MATVGLVGLGIMGSAMSQHLLDGGCAVLGYDLDADRIRELESRGGTSMSSVRYDRAVAQALADAAALLETLDREDRR